MNLESIKNSLTESEIFHSETTILDNATVVGYEKKFKWSWVATQLNTFIVATDLKDEEITVEIIEKHLSESFKFSKNNYTGWPRGLQSALGVISVLISTKMNEEAKEYCRKLKSDSQSRVRRIMNADSRIQNQERRIFFSRMSQSTPSISQ